MILMFPLENLLKFLKKIKNALPDSWVLIPYKLVLGTIVALKKYHKEVKVVCTS